GTNKNNRFVARLAFLVQPVGKALDINTAHNTNAPNGGIGFIRNQGVGPWEMNLSALLSELSPVWNYSYGPFPLPQTQGQAFNDALALVNFRHQWGNQVPKGLTRFKAGALTAGFPPSKIGRA